MRTKALPLAQPERTGSRMPPVLVLGPLRPHQHTYSTPCPSSTLRKSTPPLPLMVCPLFWPTHQSFIRKFANPPLTHGVFECLLTGQAAARRPDGRLVSPVGVALPAFVSCRLVQGRRTRVAGARETHRTGKARSKPRFRQKPQFDGRGRALPPVRWLFDLRCARVLRAGRIQRTSQTPYLNNLWALFASIFAPSGLVWIVFLCRIIPSP